MKRAARIAQFTALFAGLLSLQVLYSGLPSAADLYGYGGVLALGTCLFSLRTKPTDVAVGMGVLLAQAAVCTVLGKPMSGWAGVVSGLLSLLIGTWHAFPRPQNRRIPR
jgi:hypothetical protein